MRKKIMFYIYRLGGGGAERTIVNIINNIDINKFDVILVISTNEGNDYINLLRKDIKIICLYVKRLRNSIPKLKKSIKNEEPDLLFSTINENNIILLLSKVLTFKDIPVIVREANNRGASGRVNIINKIVTKFLYNKFSSQVVALSNGVKEDLISNFQIDKEKLNVIYNPVEIEYIQKKASEKIDFDFDNKKVIVSVGRLTEQKDFFTLIRAFKIILEKEDAKLIILGKGPQKVELINLCKSLNIEENVIFEGFKSNPYKYIKKADLFTLTSKWEGFGHVIVEAMSLGIPVVSTDCQSGPREIIKNNEYGVLVPVTDYKSLAKEMTLLLQDETRNDYYRNKGLERANKFKAQEVTVLYEELFLKELNKDNLQGD
ncbi:glycosyltransferase [Salisediminibacterium halotolerans]|uniref:glycosyltransferase n=1 Tax=Salisediminibacterium halotolerans TaxID=517425 RepID=UPI000EB28E0E|nr:glycosyltransferase [Salisediminibacterium halotolerans]RLJ75715.1 glycosyltransferase involved in cell wall biosynthesis [Actinophytocola xinjiangensis]RPE89569.1 glycosyltransferase involved in cell wall biosynthesis [Salisediminibacterium halotolerans]TWG36328.1 glycosyltransferase involved in cell wall biosynthesis [Salisediminibacterium halotolerans]GEL07224.1 glycosyl transferase [Salisediminibacterium halotolerans]